MGDHHSGGICQGTPTTHGRHARVLIDWLTFLRFELLSVSGRCPLSSSTGNTVIWSVLFIGGPSCLLDPSYGGQLINVVTISISQSQSKRRTLISTCNVYAIDFALTGPCLKRFPDIGIFSYVRNFYARQVRVGRTPDVLRLSFVYFVWIERDVRYRSDSFHYDEALLQRFVYVIVYK